MEHKLNILKAKISEFISKSGPYTTVLKENVAIYMFRAF